MFWRFWRKGSLTERMNHKRVCIVYFRDQKLQVWALYLGKIVCFLLPVMLSLLHGDYLEDAGEGLLVLFLDGISPEEDDQVAWKTEYRWGQGELSAHLPCHWCPSWTRPVDGGCGGPGWCWGAGRRGDGPAGSRRSCYTLRHQLQFSPPCEETAFWLWKSFLREDRQGIKAEK